MTRGATEATTELACDNSMPPEIQEIDANEYIMKTNTEVYVAQFLSDERRRGSNLHHRISDTVPIAPTAKKCPGYTLELAEDQSVFALYPFILHSRQELPWSFAMNGEHLILWSNKCIKFSELSCILCSRLHDNTIVMGIQHRALSSADPKTPWHWLSAAHMYSLLEKKNGTD